MATTHNDDERYNKAIGANARGGIGEEEGKFILGSLLDHFNYTYHLRFTMLNPTQAKKMDASLGVVMVESAATTRYIIDSFELTQSVGWTRVTRSAFGGRGTLNLTEAGGASFLDSILRAATFLKIPNYLEATYLMEVSFPTESPEDIKLPTYKWLFKCTGITTNVSQAGSAYAIQLVDVSQSAITSVATTIKEAIVLDKIETFGDFVEEIEKKLNNAQTKKIKTTHLVNDEYEFIYPQSWKSWKFENVDQPDENDPLMRSRTDPSRIQVKITKGTNFLDIIGQALGSTVNFQKWISDKSSSGEAPDRDKTDELSLSTIKKFYRIQTDVDYIKYDVLRGDYARKYTYKIMSYLEPRLDAGMAKTYVPNIGNKSQANARIDKLRKTGLLKKVYAHTGTGINTNVLNFDCTIDASYFQLQPVFNSASLDFIPGYKFKQGGKHKENALLDDIKKLDAKIEKLQTQIESMNPAESGVQQQTKENAINERNAKIDELSKSPSTSNERLTPPTTSNKGRMTGLTYVEQFQNEEEYLNPNSFPVKFIEDANQPTNMEAFPGGTHRGRAFFNTTYLNLSSAPEFSKIDLHIKGDPYWFGSPNTIRDDLPENTWYANYELGSNCFFFTMNFPSTSLATMDSNSQYGSPDEDNIKNLGLASGGSLGQTTSMLTADSMSKGQTDGLGVMTSPEPWVQEANGLEAVYQVTQIISNFSNGQFTQHLYGFRDVTVNIALIAEELKKNISQIKLKTGGN